MLCSKSYCDQCGDTKGPFFAGDNGITFEVIDPVEVFGKDVPEDVVELLGGEPDDDGEEDDEDEFEENESSEGIIQEENKDPYFETLPNLSISIELLSDEDLPLCLCNPCIAALLRSLANEFEKDGIK